MAERADFVAQTQPAEGQATTQDAVPPVVEWRFIIGYHGDQRVVVKENRPVVRIYQDGRVEMSLDLMIGGPDLVPGKLSAEEMERFMKALRRITHGLEGKELVFATLSFTPFHEIEVHIDDQEPIRLITCMRYGELEQTMVPSIIATRGEAWLDVMGGTRYEAMRKCSPPYLANRVVWLELEAEILRAAAQSRLPDRPRDRVPSQLPGLQGPQ